MNQSSANGRNTKRKTKIADESHLKAKKSRAKGNLSEDIAIMNSSNDFSNAFSSTDIDIDANVDNSFHDTRISTLNSDVVVDVDVDVDVSISNRKLYLRDCRGGRGQLVYELDNNIDLSRQHLLNAAAITLQREPQSFDLWVAADDGLSSIVYPIVCSDADKRNADSIPMQLPDGTILTAWLITGSFIGPKESLQALAQNFCMKHAASIEQYPSGRRVLGDGNCYFTCLAVNEQTYGQANMPYFRQKIVNDMYRGKLDYPMKVV